MVLQLSIDANESSLIENNGVTPEIGCKLINDFFTPSKSERKGEKDQKTLGRDQRKILGLKENVRLRVHFCSV